MATGDTNDMVARLRALLPRRWFPDTAPVLTAVLTGFGTTLAAVYSQISFTRLQTRIATATGAFLDMIAVDYFGLSLTRFANEADAAFSARIRANLFPPRNTRAALVQALVSLTGRTPAVFEPANPYDAGGYGVGKSIGYGAAGGWGSLALPFQAFVTAYRPIGGGVANVAGFYTGTGWAGGGYGAGAIEYITPSMIAGQVTDAAIQSAVNASRPAGTIAWMRITT